MLAFPCRLSHVSVAVMVLKTCCTIHNMTAARKGIKRTLQFRRALQRRDEVSEHVVAKGRNRSECQHEKATVWRERIDGLEGGRAHGKLMRALMDHIWSSSGDLKSEDERGELSENESD